jgi:hypothetical protein
MDINGFVFGETLEKGLSLGLFPGEGADSESDGDGLLATLVPLG